VTKQAWCWAFLLCACGGGGASAPVEPAKTAATAVQGFMQAVADSNLDKMASLWGTASGPSSKTKQPQDYQRRIAIMRAYLRNDGFRLISDAPQGPDRRALQVQIRRQVCTWNVPFVSVKTADGSWLVTQVDLNAAGNPARPCEPGNRNDSLPKP
jgi:hypothetical protein